MSIKMSRSGGLNCGDMKRESSIIFNAGMLLILLGAFIGVPYGAAAAWGDWEAVQFQTSVSFRSDKSLTTLRCPVLLTTGETGRVSLTVGNPTDRKLTRAVRIYISEGYVDNMRQFIAYSAENGHQFQSMVDSNSG